MCTVTPSDTGNVLPLPQQETACNKSLPDAKLPTAGADMPDDSQVLSMIRDSLTGLDTRLRDVEADRAMIATIQDHEVRLRTVEHRIYLVAAGSSLLGGVAGGQAGGAVLQLLGMG